MAPRMNSRETFTQARRSPTTVSSPSSVKALMTTVEVASSLSEITAVSWLFAPRNSSSYAATSSCGSKIGCLATKMSDDTRVLLVGGPIDRPRPRLDPRSVEQGHNAHDGRREYQRGQEVAHLHVLEPEQLQRDPDDQDPARADKRCERLAALREDVLEAAGTERDPALDHEHRDRREAHSPAQRARERDRRESVQERLRGQRAVVAGQAVLDRAHDRERADAEQQ